MRTAIVIFVVACLYTAFTRGLFRLPVSDGQKAKVLNEITQSVGEHDLNCRAPARNKCIIMYVAPWCSACKQILSEYYKDLIIGFRGFPNVGFEIVIGADKDENIQAMGKTLDRPYFSDPSQKVFQTLGMHAFPSFAGVTKDGKVLKTFEGFHYDGSTRSEAMVNFIKEFL